MTTWTDHVTFTNKSLERKWKNRKIPMADVYEAYFDGDIDIPGNIYDFLQARNDLTSFRLTPRHIQWAATNLLPEIAIHSKAQDTRIVREHYDRGNDFFGWFLGERMVYTSGFYRSEDDSLEQAQDNKLDLVCQKLQLKPGDKMLDIGCGWGTLVRHAAKYYGVDATGITLSKNQTEFGNKRIADWGLSDKARIICSDYRDIVPAGYNKISSLEMVEHVGVKNLRAFYEQCYDLLDDQGMFLLQWTGLRGVSVKDVAFGSEDLIWGLFMNKYIFPGADASLCPSPMIKSMESAGFEMHAAENITQHYVYTLEAWHQNWMANKEKILATYGERWYRIWHFFLPWSAIIGRVGAAACLQITLNKNMDSFDRNRWIEEDNANLGERSEDFAKGRVAA